MFAFLWADFLRFQCFCHRSQVKTTILRPLITDLCASNSDISLQKCCFFFNRALSCYSLVQEVTERWIVSRERQGQRMREGWRERARKRARGETELYVLSLHIDTKEVFVCFWRQNSIDALDLYGTKKVCDISCDIAVNTLTYGRGRRS